MSPKCNQCKRLIERLEDGVDAVCVPINSRVVERTEQVLVGREFVHARDSDIARDHRKICPASCFERARSTRLSSSQAKVKSISIALQTPRRTPYGADCIKIQTGRLGRPKTCLIYFHKSCPSSTSTARACALSPNCKASIPSACLRKYFPFFKYSNKSICVIVSESNTLTSPLPI